MAREKHLTSVHIGNFKRFVDFKVENLGQFNLILGDNNAGKTSFLEALMVDENGAEWIRNLDSIITQRTNESFNYEFLECLKEYYTDLVNGNEEHSSIAIDLETLEGKTSHTLQEFKLERDSARLDGMARERILLQGTNRAFTITNNGDVTVVVNDDEVVAGIRNDPFVPFIPFIPFGLGYANDVEDFFGDNIDSDVEQRLLFIEKLKIFVPNIQDVRIGQKSINIFEEGQNYAKPLYSYGEGFVKFFRILCELTKTKGKRLMIDEIDAGIHHSKFKEFWTKLIQAATAYDVQIFATTHNEECLKYFQSALESETLEAQRDLSRVILLRENKDKSVLAQVHDYKNMLEAEAAGYELRGNG